MRTKHKEEKMQNDEALEFDNFVRGNYTEDMIPKPVSIYSQIADFQNEVPILIKDTKGYGYNYADLTQINRVITPLLYKHGLGVIQPLTSEGVNTIIFSTITGEKIETYCKIPQGVDLKGMNTYQSYGSAISYFRRYALVSFFNLIADQDTDASGEQVKHEAKAKRTISDNDLEQALQMVSEGSYTIDKLQKNYALTNSQNKTIENFLGI